MKEFVQAVFSPDPAHFAVLAFFALIGAALSLLWQTNKRNPMSVASPVHFSLNFFWCDNAKRVYASAILIYLALRFTPDMIGMPISDWGAVLIGLGNDQLALLIKKKTSLLDPKQ